MKKFTINGVEFNNFGPNNYSDGMELITVNNPPKDFVQRVLKGEFYGIYLNPSAPCCEDEFFGVFGTSEQYEKFYRNQRDCQVSKILMAKFGGLEGLQKASREEYSKAREDSYNEYKDWWEK